MPESKGTLIVMTCSLGCFGGVWVSVVGFWVSWLFGFGFRLWVFGCLGFSGVLFYFIFSLFLIWFPLYTSCMLRGALCLFNNISLLIYQKKEGNLKLKIKIWNNFFFFFFFLISQQGKHPQRPNHNRKPKAPMSFGAS